MAAAPPSNSRSGAHALPEQEHDSLSADVSALSLGDSPAASPQDSPLLVPRRPRYQHGSTGDIQSLGDEHPFYDDRMEKQLVHADAHYWAQHASQPNSLDASLSISPDGRSVAPKRPSKGSQSADPRSGRDEEADSVTSPTRTLEDAMVDDEEVDEMEKELKNEVDHLRSIKAGGGLGLGTQASAAMDGHLATAAATATAAEPTGPQGLIGAAHMTAELHAIYSSLATCLEIRDKYIRVSRQRLEDNPRNYDGEFHPQPDSTGPSSSLDSSVVPPMSEGQSAAGAPSSSSSGPHPPSIATGAPTLKKWKIYPAPLRPHWKHPDEDLGSAHPGGDEAAEPAMPAEPNEFFWEECEIPGRDEQDRIFAVDSKGVYQVYARKQSGNEGAAQKPLYTIPTIREYFLDLEYILGVISDGPTKSFAFRRLKYLESKWNLYVLLNEYQELADMKRVPHRDFYNVRKVDTHVHHSSCMNQKHLLRFIKAKMKRSPDDVVIKRDGKTLTLREVFASLGLTSYDLSIDTLDMHAHKDSFHRFDNFNLKYSPIGESRLREIFLKTDNYINGRYLAELTKELMSDLHISKYQMAEYRISVYGRHRAEWDKLAKWIVHNKLFSDQVRWLVQVPRLYEQFKKGGLVDNFADIVQNVFEPLFEVTQDPSTHPELHVFLQRVIGLDCVDDESKPERRLYRKYPLPQDWNTTQNPPFNYWLYYLYANLASLNNWRSSRGFNTLVLRPHAGEAGDTDHLTSAFLTSHSISHGILLRKVPALQYLFYLRQIGIAMSPLSNNALFLTYERNPFLSYFKAGMNVSLSTDDPLQFHYTKEPLVEEYSVAAQIYKLSPADMCELARNSVLQSGFELELKRHWLGHDFYLPGTRGNVILRSNVPNVRLAFRQATLEEELTMISRGADAETLRHASAQKQADSQAGANSRLLETNSDPAAIGAAAMGMGRQMTLIPGVSLVDARTKQRKQSIKDIRPTSLAMTPSTSSAGAAETNGSNERDGK